MAPYLARCSLAFRSTVGIFQRLASQRVRGPAELSPTRVDLYEDWPRSEIHSRFPTLNRFQLVGNGCAEEVLFIFHFPLSYRLLLACGFVETGR